MPDFKKKMCHLNKRVGVFPLREKYLDVGRKETYEKAEKFYKEMIS